AGTDPVHPFSTMTDWFLTKLPTPSSINLSLRARQFSVLPENAKQEVECYRLYRERDAVYSTHFGFELLWINSVTNGGRSNIDAPKRCQLKCLYSGLGPPDGAEIGFNF